MQFPFSIYIPRMSLKHDEISVKKYLEMFHVGVVCRVDFTPINKKPGFVEDVNSSVKSAFIHFYDIPLGYFGQGFPYDVNIWSEIVSGKGCKIAVSEEEYWILLKNNKPVQNTLMNIHQVVENGRHLENLIQEQAKIIEEQSYAIQKLSEKLDIIQSIVEQMNNEEQDTALYARKQSKNNDESTICTDIVDDLLVKELSERAELWREEDKYMEMMEEAAADWAEYIDDRW
jgi:hypothetical protein